MSKIVTVVAGLIVLAGLAILILGSAVVAGMWCLHMAGLRLTYTQAGWILLALWSLWLGLRLFGAMFAWLQRRGNERQIAASFTDHVAASPITRQHLN